MLLVTKKGRFSYPLDAAHLHRKRGTNLERHQQFQADGPPRGPHAWQDDLQGQASEYLKVDQMDRQTLLASAGLHASKHEMSPQLAMI